MTTLIFSAGGCPSYPFYSFKRGPWNPVFGENPSRAVATKDHSSSKPPKGNPPDLKTKVDVSKVDVKGFPIFLPFFVLHCPLFLPCFLSVFFRDVPFFLRVFFFIPVSSFAPIFLNLFSVGFFRHFQSSSLLSLSVFFHRPGGKTCFAKGRPSRGLTSGQEKEHAPPPMAPFSVCRPTPRSQSQISRS